MGETSSQRTFRSAWARLGAHCQRHEDKFSVGVPDMDVCLNGVQYWLEAKHLKQLPVRGTSMVRFGAKNEDRLITQAMWLEKRRMAGGNAFLWVRDPLGWCVYVPKHPSDFTVLHEGCTLNEYNVLFKRFESAKALVDGIISEVNK